VKPELDREGLRRLEEMFLARLPDGVRNLVAVVAEPSGRILVSPKKEGGIPARRSLRRIGEALRTLGAYYVDEGWPSEPYWAIPAKKAVELAEARRP
jgi:hypothetical protein